MYESPDIEKINEEREEMKKHLTNKYKGTFPFIDIITDITIELKRLQDRMGKIEAKKRS